MLKSFLRFVLLLIPENRVGDRLFSFICFLRDHGRLPTNNLRFNDVLYKIKTTDELANPLRVFVTDKEFVKLYVKAIVGDRFNVPTVRVLRSIDEDRDYQFPPDCCIKPTHLSGKVILRRRHEPINYEEIAGWFGSTHYQITREVNYKTLKPKVMVEPIIFDSDNLADFKIFCYRGKAKLIQVDLDRHFNHARKFFDLHWNEMPFSCLYPRATRRVERPANLGEMVAVAASLGSNFDFVRVDLYSNGKECLVGEITNCHGNASERFTPLSGEAMASDLIFGRD